jgi:hypothetical protein
VKARTGIETSAICVCAVLVIASVVLGAEKLKAPYIIPLVAIPLLAWLWQLTTGSKATRNEITSGAEYRQLADEYRRLADLAITAQEHTDLKLGDVSVRIDYLREQMESLQKILKEVE